MHVLFVAVLLLTQQWLIAGDLHVNAFDSNPVPSDYQQDSNWPLVDSAIAQMRRVQPHADVIVIPGDLLAHQWGSKARAAGRDPERAAVQTFASIRERFAKAFPRARFLLALGNNDDPCGDYRTGRDSAYRAQLARVWTPLVNRGGATSFARDFVHGGYYRADLGGGRIALVLDSVYWSIFYRPCGRGSIADEQFVWLEQQLRSLKSGQRAILVMHIPPGVDPTATLEAHRFVIVPYWNLGARSRFVGDLQRERARVAFVIAAHMHRTDVRLFGGVPILIASSISPIYDNNPTFTEVTFAGSGTPSDVRTYAYDEEGRTWGLQLDWNRDFALDAFSAQNVDALHRRIASDSDIRARWAQSTVSGSDEWYGVRRRWRAFWCAQTQVDGGYVTCAGDERRTYAVYAALAAIIAVVAGGLVWYSVRRLWGPRPRSGA